MTAAYSVTIPGVCLSLAPGASLALLVTTRGTRRVAAVLESIGIALSQPQGIFMLDLASELLAKLQHLLGLIIMLQCLAQYLSALLVGNTCARHVTCGGKGLQRQIACLVTVHIP